MRIFHDYKVTMLLLCLFALNSCAYYNTFYNAEQYFAEAQDLTRDNQQEKVSRQELLLYTKAIEKSRKLLSKYPDSKYRDDAQFLIARSHFYKGDYSSAKSAFEKLASEYSDSPHTSEVPLWLGRCLVQLGDLEMGRHEAAKILRPDASKSVKADALLMMGEIAVKQDSFELAERYLEEAIKTSPDGYTRAKARFELGQILEFQQQYERALKAYEGVSRYDPSEALKIEAIIRQTSMLKLMGQNEEAIDLIQEMLESDRFVDIRGQLEVELGKLYRSMGETEKAIIRFQEVVEKYTRTAEAAAANYFLGELYLMDTYDYLAAREAYSDIKKQFSRSSYAEKGLGRLRQIDRYEKIQQEFNSLTRQLAGFQPAQAKKGVSQNRRTRTEPTGRKSRRELTDEREIIAKETAPKASDLLGKEKDAEPVPVSAEDSLKLRGKIDVNRYSLAEYMLFEFARVDTVLLICQELEANCLDESIREQSAYMRYYALDIVSGNQIAAEEVLEHIKQTYPAYYKRIKSSEKLKAKSNPEIDSQFLQAADLFDEGEFKGAERIYKSIWQNAELTPEIRSRACFNYAWMNDHFLYNKDAALLAYQTLIENYPDAKTQALAKERIERLTFNDDLDKSAGSPLEEGNESDRRLDNKP